MSRRGRWPALPSALVLPCSMVLATCAFAQTGASLDACDAQVAERPGDLEAYRCYYSYARETFDEDGARTSLERIVQSDPSRTHARLILGRLLSLHENQRSLELFRQCVDDYVREGDASGEGWARAYLAVNLMRASDFDGSEVEARRAAEIASSLAEGSLLAQALFQQSRLARLRGDLSELWSVLRRLELSPGFDSLAASFRCAVYEQLAYATDELGLDETATAYLDRSVAIADENGLDVPLVTGWYDKAHLALDLYAEGKIDRDEAHETLRMARSVAERGRGENSPAVLASLRIWEVDLLDDEEAIATLRDLGRSSGDEGTVAAMIELKLAHRLRRHDSASYDEAEEHFERALALYASSGQGAQIVDTLADLARHRLEGPDPESGIVTSLAALDAIESMHEGQSGERMATLSFAGYAPVYRRLVAALLATDASSRDLSLAFTVGERMRARQLREYLDRTAGPHPDVDSPEVARRKEVLQAISSRQLQRFDSRLDDADRERLTRELERLEEEEAALQAAILRADPGRSSTGTAEIPGPERVRTDLASDEALLSFVAGAEPDDPSWLIVLTVADEQAYRIASTREIEDALPFWLGVLARGDGTEGPGAARLCDELLGPALADLPTGVTRLIVVPDGPLYGVPFDALRRREQEPPLALRYEIVVVPSATVWHRLRGVGQSTGEPEALLLADPEVPSSAQWPVERRNAWRLAGRLGRLGRLPYSRYEVREARRWLGGRGEVLEGRAASEAAVKAASLDRFRVLHFAAHAVLDEEDPARSGVLLARGSEGEDGLLQAREVRDLPLGGAVVVLSACQTAGGEIVAGEGMMSLARSFFEARAPAVVGSLWAVRDRDAAALMAAFYRQLGAGRSIATAMAEAKRERIAAGAPASAWAGMTVLGDGGRAPWPELPAASWIDPGRVGLGIAAIVLLWLGWIVTRRRHAAASR